MEQKTLSHGLLTAGLASLTTYVVVVVSEILPVALLNPVWQINASVTLIDNAFVALVGLVLLALAAWIDPSSKAVNRCLGFASRMAVWASLGFIFLIPLQIQAGWRSKAVLLDKRVQQLELTRRRLDSFRASVAAASSTAEIEALLKSNQGVQLSPQDKNRPVADLRQGLLARLDAARQQIPDTRRQKAGWQWSTLQRTVRLVLLALVNAIGFAALAQRREGPFSLLRAWLLNLQAVWIRWIEAVEARIKQNESNAAFKRDILISQELERQRRMQDQLDLEAISDLESAELSHDQLDVPILPADSNSTPSEQGFKAKRNRMVADFDYFHAISTMPTEEPNPSDPYRPTNEEADPDQRA